jgi:hypothetical protein
VVGFAVAINGKVEGAEVFGSAALFRKVWPRLMKAAAVDALSEFEKDKKFAPASAKDVEKFLANVAETKGMEMRLAAENSNQRGRGLYRANANPNVQQADLSDPSLVPSLGIPAIGPVLLELRLKHFQRDTDKVLIVESQARGAILHRSYTAR